MAKKNDKNNTKNIESIDWATRFHQKLLVDRMCYGMVGRSISIMWHHPCCPYKFKHGDESNSVGHIRWKENGFVFTTIERYSPSPVKHIFLINDPTCDVVSKMFEPHFYILIFCSYAFKQIWYLIWSLSSVVFHHLYKLQILFVQNVYECRYVEYDHAKMMYNN